MISRRHFLSSTVGAAAGFAGLQILAGSGPVFAQPYKNDTTVFGPLVPDPEDLLDLPAGFTYRVLSRAGEMMSDGLTVPRRHDGMAAFPGPKGRTVIVCNHELGLKWGGKSAFQEEKLLNKAVKAGRLYDAGTGDPSPGGTTTLVYNPKNGKVEKHFLSLAGTAVNCAGGPTSWGSWLSCEETEDLAGDGMHLKNHGYVFEVPARPDTGIVDPIPLKAMGRFKHEAIAEDPRTGIIYLTEDQRDGLVYRFIPNTPGKLLDGGRLQALAIQDDKAPQDTRNWKTEKAGQFPIGGSVQVAWQDLTDIDTPDNDLRLRGAAKGAAVFARGEGMWFGNSSVYFACTEGGPARIGQVFRYRPSPFEGTLLEKDVPATLELFVETTDPERLEKADNLTVAPWGHLMICEDGGQAQFIRGVTQSGQIYTVARNPDPRNSEFAGVCFGPDMRTMFVNIQVPGTMLAITGPWEKALSVT